MAKPIPQRHVISHRIAANTGASARSVQKVMDGGTVRGKVGEAIKSQLSKVKAPPPPKPKTKK